MPAHLYVAIVDDDASVGRSMSRLLQQSGFVPIAFTSAEDFLADPMREHFSCLLADVRLRGMSGLELHQALLAQGSHLPVIYLTAHDDPASREEALRNGCAAFFRKTDAGQNIIAAVRGASAATRPAK